MWPVKTSEPSDRALVRSFLRSRDERSFRALYQRYTAIMLRMAHKLVGRDNAAAEDIIQEAWVRAVRNLPTFQWRSSLSSWLCGIVINVAREGRRPRRPVTDSDRVDDEWEAAELWVDPVDSLALSEALGGLPDGYRSVIALHDVAGFTHDEIATILSIDPGTSKSQLARGRQKLRDLLRPQGDKS